MWETWSPETDNGTWEYVFAPAIDKEAVSIQNYLVLAMVLRTQTPPSPYMTPIFAKSPEGIVVDGMFYTIIVSEEEGDEEKQQQPKLMRRPLFSRPILLHIWNKVDELYALLPNRGRSPAVDRIGRILDTLLLSRVQVPRRSVFEQVRQALVEVERTRRRNTSINEQLFEGLQKIHDLLFLLDYERD